MLPLQQAKADTMCCGWDFGGGHGIGFGTSPAAYGMHYCGPVATRGRCDNPWPL